MILYIKNMVCASCKLVVQYELEKLGLHCVVVNLGSAETEETLSALEIDKIRIAFLQCGLELMDNKKNILIEKIKNVVVEMVRYSETRINTNFSDHLSRKLEFDYTYLANLFSQQQGTTIEHFIILNKVQRVKELIELDELNLTEISWKMHYSSVAHLSTQFKKVTGITPSHFKQMERADQTALQNV